MQQLSPKTPDAFSTPTSLSKEVLRLAVQTLSLSSTYFACGWLIDVFFRNFGLFPAPLWPSASVAIIGVAFLRWRAWPGIFLGSLLVNHTLFNASLAVAAAISITNTAGPAIGVWLTRRYATISSALFGIREAAAFTACAIVLHGAVVASGGAVTLYMAEIVPAAAVLPTFIKWWLSDAGGTLVFAPAAILWSMDAELQIERERWKEFTAVSTLAIAGTAILFLALRFEQESYSTLPFLVLVPFTWLSSRFPVRDACTLFALGMALVVVGTVAGRGPFTAPGVQQPLFAVGIFLVTGFLVILSSGALANERRRAERALAESVDILEHRVTERTAELRASEDQLRLILEHAPFAVSVMTPDDGRVLYANEHARETYGADDALGNIDWAREVWADLLDRDRLLASVASCGATRDIEVQLIRNGEPFTALLSAAKTVFDGQPAVIVGTNDITARKRAEDAVRQSEQRLRLLTETMSDVVWVLDSDLRYRYVTPSVERLCGYTPEEAMALSLRDRLTAKSYNVMQGIIRRACTMAAGGGAGPTIDVRTELQLTHKNGPATWCEVCATLSFDDHGQFVGMQGVTRDISARKQLEDSLREMATTDPLTGLLNRRALLERLSEEIDRCRRYGRPLCVAMVDLDHFKRINDAHGHAIGDAVLRTFAATCRSLLRECDVVGRLGGEEFAVIMPETSLDGARAVAERLRQKVAERPHVAESERLAVTVSLGLTVVGDEDDASSVLVRADRGLYAAKHAGRNRVSVALPPVGSAL